MFDSIKDTIDRWLDGLVRVSTTGDMTLKSQPNVHDLHLYTNPKFTDRSVTALSATVFIVPLGKMYIITHLTVMNNNRAAIGRYNIQDTSTSWGVISAGGTQSNAAGMPSDALEHGQNPLILHENERLIVFDNNYVAGDTLRYTIRYYEVMI